MLVDLYVRRDYTGEFRIRVQPESGQRYVITIKETHDAEYGPPCLLCSPLRPTRAQFPRIEHYFDFGQRPAARSPALWASRS